MATNFIQSADVSDAEEETISEPMSGQFMYRMPSPEEIENYKKWGLRSTKLDPVMILPEDDGQWGDEYLTADQAKEYLEKHNGHS